MTDRLLVLVFHMFCFLLLSFIDGILLSCWLFVCLTDCVLLILLLGLIGY